LSGLLFITVPLERLVSWLVYAFLGNFAKRMASASATPLPLRRIGLEAVANVSDLDLPRAPLMARAVLAKRRACFSRPIKRNSSPGWV